MAKWTKQKRRSKPKKAVRRLKSRPRKNKTSKKLKIPRMPTIAPKAITFKLVRKQTWVVHSGGMTAVDAPPAVGNPHPNTKCVFRFRCNSPGSDRFPHESGVRYYAAIPSGGTPSMEYNKYYENHENATKHYSGLATWCGAVEWNHASAPGYKWTETLPALFRDAVVVSSTLSGRYTAKDNNQKTDNSYIMATTPPTTTPLYAAGFQSARNYIATGTFRVDAQNSSEHMQTHVVPFEDGANMYDFKGRLQGYTLKEARNVQGTDNTNVQIGMSYNARKETQVAALASADEQVFHPVDQQLVDPLTILPEPGKRIPTSNFEFVIVVGPSDENKVCHDFKLEIMETMIVKVWNRDPLGISIAGKSKLISAASARDAYGMAAMSHFVAANSRLAL